MEEPVYKVHHYVYAGEEVTIAASPDPGRVWVKFKDGHWSHVRTTHVVSVSSLVKGEE